MKRFLDGNPEPADLRKLTLAELKDLAVEIRERIINVTSKKGGHIAASLGVVDLAIAVHYAFESPKDKIVWDVGHQSYAHKILTGRAKRFDTLRELGGLSGFPNAGESEYDLFTCGHSATSISSALGLASARDLAGESHKVISIIGDASLSTGLAFEGLNNAGHMKTDFIVILNDNEHFISKPVGAMSKYLNTVISNPLYNRVRSEAEKAVKGIPGLGPTAYNAIKKFQEGLKNLIVPGIVFEELGFRYFGPIDGHNIEQLIAVFRNIQSLKEPVFIHTITRKGKGYKYAEADPTGFHGISGFDIESGAVLNDDKEKSFTDYFSEKIVELAAKDKRIVAITAAMPDGTGLNLFAKKFPERFFDVGITEPHAVTFAAGLAKEGMKPIVAVYSTFFQRSYDQVIHDVALQNLPVIFCLDRAGLVGRDGPTHHGIFDMACLRSVPNLIIMAPKDGFELGKMLEKALEWSKPICIRYPKDTARQLVSASSCAPLEIGKAEELRKGKDLAILAAGSMVNTALKTSEILSHKGIEAFVINARFIKPLDSRMLEKIFHTVKSLFILEEGVAVGGLGSGVLEFAARENISGVKIKCFGLPDEFIEHGSREELLRKYHLTADEIAATILAERSR